jgi:hygromycin-B 4-O-kinase
MDSPSPVTETAARTFLSGHLGDGVHDLELAGEGAWSRCYGFRHADRDLVIRFGRFVDDFQNDRRASRFARPGLAIPQVHEIGRAFDAWFAISDRVRGEPLEAGDAAAWREVLPSLLAALDAMREVDLRATAGWGGWGPSGNAAHASWRDHLLAVNRDAPEDRTHGWRRRLKASAGGVAVFRSGYLKLAELAEAAPSTRHLVHSDLINRNAHVVDGRITGIFDWGCSIYGDFLYEVAWLEFWSPWYEGMDAIDWRAETRRHFQTIDLEVPDVDARMHACMLHIGLAHIAYHAWSGSVDELAAVEKRIEPLLV